MCNVLLKNSLGLHFQIVVQNTQTLLRKQKIGKHVWSNAFGSMLLFQDCAKNVYNMKSFSHISSIVVLMKMETEKHAILF
jgi:hypothetical protein